MGYEPEHVRVRYLLTHGHVLPQIFVVLIALVDKNNGDERNKPDRPQQDKENSGNQSPEQGQGFCDKSPLIKIECKSKKASYDKIYEHVISSYLKSF